MDRDTLLKFMQDTAPRPLSLRELCAAFGIVRKERESFKKLVTDLVRDGSIVKIKGGRYGLPHKMNLVTGAIECHPDGYGFVIPDDGGEDVFIKQRLLNGAMHRDRVVVRVEGFKRGGKRDGRVIRILERTNKTIVGRLEKGKGFNIVVPLDERLTSVCIIPERDKGMAQEGDVVIAEVVKWQDRGAVKHFSAPVVGRIIEVLGDYEDPDVEIEVIARKYNLPYIFPSEVIGDANRIPQTVEEHEFKGRVDLRNITTFTIDGETAKDFDDAVSIEKLRNGCRLWVSIADVSHYVKENSNLDKEAFTRGTSVYFPGRCIPMLPEQLSNGICSLNPNVDRLAFTAEMEFDKDGGIRKFEFYESVIKSIERLTYTNVKAILVDNDNLLKSRYSHIIDDLNAMEELCLKLKEQRNKKGSIDFDLPEPEIIIDIEGRIEDIVKSERNIAHQMIEEFMLLANQSVAVFMSSSNFPFLYRVHEEPDADEMLVFREFISNFGYNLDIKEMVKPKILQRLLEAVKGKPEEKLINHVLLRSMKQARYSEENTGHFGLAFDYYTHFTSPIRRYPDLIVHRLLKTALKKRFSDKEKERWKTVLPDMAGHTSKTERNAMEAEREVVDLKKAQFMKDKVGEVFEGFISGVTSFGFFVELKGYFVEGLVHVTSLQDGYYIFNEKQHSLIGERTKKRFRIGDEVRVKIQNVDIGRRQIDLVPAG
ncbi:MAG: ribonuclease R [Deltaproteobacteria bacterium GWC2_42_11]|nr:MAG: ribonuclease R [Deltaproteobacteria bacterium GWC2_42_11]